MKWVVKAFLSAGIGLPLVLSLPSSDLLAQSATPPGLRVSIGIDRTVYRLTNDPINVTLLIENISGASVITREGFSTQDFRLVLTFTDPDNKTFVARQLSFPAPEPKNPSVVTGVPVDFVETLASTFRLSTLFNAREFYDFAKPGFHSVVAHVTVRTFPSITFPADNAASLASANFQGEIVSNKLEFTLVADQDADGFAFPMPASDVLPGTDPTRADCHDQDATVNPGRTEVLNNGKDDDCNPSTPDIPFVAPGKINIKVDKHTVGTGNTPNVNKQPIANMLIRAFDKTSSLCAASIGFNKPASVWNCPFTQAALTRASADAGGPVGTATLIVPPGNYLVVGEYDPNGSTTATPPVRDGDEVYVSHDVGPIASSGTVQKYMQVIVRADGSIVPAKYTIKTGTQLMIIEPEYVLWDGSQELYPFIFETDGDWTVTTSVNPPAGFTADQKNLTTDINSSLKAAQFTITDVGSAWVPTDVTYTIKHKKKTTTVRSKIGVRLSTAFAATKQLTVDGASLTISGP